MSLKSLHTEFCIGVCSSVSVIPRSKSGGCKRATTEDKATVASIATPQFWDFSRHCTTSECGCQHGTSQHGCTKYCLLKLFNCSVLLLTQIRIKLNWNRHNRTELKLEPNWTKWTQMNLNVRVWALGFCRISQGLEKLVFLKYNMKL